MAKDYANRNKQKPRGKGSKAKAKPKNNKMLVFTILLLVLFVGALFYLKQNEAISVFNNPQQHSSKGKRPAQKKKQAEKPRFEFYTLLPKMDVGNHQTPVADTPTPKRVVNNSKYMVQVASFSSYKEADRLKAQLLLMGFNVDVKSFSSKGKTWYRVQTGPYISQAAATKMQRRLMQSNFKSILRKVG